MLFQSTAARGGRHWVRSIRDHCQEVSIHARARRATIQFRNGATLRFMFQSTPARGGRRRVQALPGPGQGRFNPRPREAGDWSKAASTPPATWFQSTPARGGRRPSPPHPAPGKMCFNPRPREAGDERGVRDELARLKVSIHARARRATLSLATPCPLTERFQSTPARGGRRLRVDGQGPAPRGFNPRPREAGDTRRLGRPGPIEGFNPRPREAGDRAGEA